MLTNEKIARQLDLVPVNILGTPITIIGAGAIGSWTMLGLAKMGFRSIQVIDFDEVDMVNMSNQFYGEKDVGQLKVDSLIDRLEDMTGELYDCVAEKYTGQKLKGVVIMAVDSMATRKQIYESQKLNMACEWIIDARMGAEIALMYTINPNSIVDQEFYEKTLYTDAEAVQEPCTAKSTTFCAMVLSGLVAKTVRDVLVRGKFMRNMAFSLKESDFLAYCTDLRTKT